MKASLYLSILALISYAGWLGAMETTQPLQQYTWQYANNIFKFKCVDSVSDEDTIELPGNLVYFSKTLKTMIDDLGDPTITIPLFKITKAAFKQIVQALALLANPQKKYHDLVAYFASLGEDRLLECILNLNFLDIQPLLLPAVEVLEKLLVQSSSDILTWKLGLPTEILGLLKNSAQQSLSTHFAWCNLNKQNMQDSFSSTAFSQDGKILAGGTWDNSIRLMMKSVTGPGILQGHTGLVDTLKFSSDGKKIASASLDDKTIRLWDIATQKEIVQFEGYDGRGSSDMSFSVDDNYFVCLTGSQKDDTEDEQYALVDRKTGRVHELTGVQGSVHDTVVSPDGKWLVLAGEKVYLWNMQTQELKVIEVGQVSPKLRVAFSPDGKLLVCSSAQTEFGTVEMMLWDMVKMKVNAPLSKIATREEVTEIAFSSDGTLMAFDDGEMVALWDVKKGTDVTYLSGLTTDVHSIEFTPDNKHLVVTAHDNVIRVFNIETEREKKLLGDAQEVIDGAYAIDTTTLVSVSEQGSVYMWDLVTGQSKELLRVPDGGGIGLLSPDKTLLAVTSKDGTINLLNIRTGEIRTFAQDSSLIDLEFSVDGQFLTAVYKNGIALFWDIKTGIAQKISGTKDTIINKARCVGDCSFIFVEEKAKNFINLYDIQNNIIHKLTAHDADVGKIAFARDGKHLISSSEDGTIILWDVRTQKIVKRLKAGVDIFAVSPQGNMLVASDEKQIYFLDLTTNKKEILTMYPSVEEDFIEDMKFNADGTLLATLTHGVKGNKLEFWDMGTRSLKNVLTDLRVGQIVNFFFVPNTSIVVIVGGTGVLFWDIDGNKQLFKYDLLCWNNAVNVSRDGLRCVLSGIDKEKHPWTYILTFDQTLLQALKNLSFEQASLIARALYAINAGTILDLSNSPQLLAIFNQINPLYRDIIKACFKIKTD